MSRGVRTPPVNTPLRPTDYIILAFEFLLRQRVYTRLNTNKKKNRLKNRFISKLYHKALFSP